MRKIILPLLGLLMAGPVSAQMPELPLPNGAPQALQAYVTGYSYWDNTSSQTVENSHPVKHRTAGGMGTYSNPVTLAVGYQMMNTETVLSVPAGTVFYLPRLRKYAIVEDTCDAGLSPEDGSCHTGYQGVVQFEIYVDGALAEKRESKRCVQKLTGVQPAVMEPGPNMSVVVGPLTESGCFIFADP